MSDKTGAARRSRQLLLAGAAGLAALAPHAASAGEAVRYEAPAPWIEVPRLPEKRNAQQVLFDTQYRLENGTVTSYIDTAVKIGTPDAAMEQGTVTLSWLPDKGDLIVHRVEILRAGGTVDVLKSATFTILRREQGLEQRMLDGALTATLAVPGLRVGDILRVAYSTTLADQALGKEMQLSQLLLTQPIQIDQARTRISWPADEPVRFRAERGVPAEATLRGGYRWLDVALPIAKAPEMPEDAPSRYARDPVLRVGTYADWAELSAAMAPIYERAARIAPGSDLARQAAAIMAQTSDPRARAALAVQRVQDDIAYLLNGLNGGNYLPQSAEETWANRYGDCKAKSVLLVALLREMGIAAEPVLVASRGGDAVPELLPVPGVFDHMIARATIAGVDYWLDGTSAGTRLANLDAVPPFFYALPLGPAAQGLVPMTPRLPGQTDLAMRVTADYSAGLDLPQVFSVEMEMAGPQGAALRALAQSQDPALMERLRTAFIPESSDDAVVSAVAVSYDEARAVAKVRIDGVSSTDFSVDAARLTLAPSPENGVTGFDPDRARADWRAIPVATGPTMISKIALVYKMPEDAGGAFTLQGEPALDARAANTHVVRNARLAGREVGVDYLVEELQGEIAPDAVAEAKRAERRIAAQGIKLVAPSTAKRRWDYDAAELARRTRPLLAHYDRAVREAEADDLRPLNARATFRAAIFDFAGAIKDIDAIIEREGDADAYMTRARLNEALGRGDAVIADLRTAYDLNPDNAVAYALADRLAYAGQAKAARELLDTLPVSADERADFAENFSIVAGLAGDTDGGLSALEDEIADKPQDAQLLNAECWFRGLFAVALDEALAGCTRAVERSENSAAALDSRAMVRYRLGDYDAALSDLDAALALSPGLANSHYLRGIVRLLKSQPGGREDIAIAMRLSPALAARYARHGVKPPA